MQLVEYHFLVCLVNTFCKYLKIYILLTSTLLVSFSKHIYIYTIYGLIMQQKLSLFRYFFLRLFFFYFFLRLIIIFFTF